MLCLVDSPGRIVLFSRERRNGRCRGEGRWVRVVEVGGVEAGETVVGI